MVSLSVLSSFLSNLPAFFYILEAKIDPIKTHVILLIPSCKKAGVATKLAITWMLKIMRKQNMTYT